MEFEIIELNISKKPNTEAIGGCKEMAMIDICTGGDAPCSYEIILCKYENDCKFDPPIWCFWGEK